MRIVFIQRSAGEGGSKMSLLESLRAARTQPDINCLIVTWRQGRFEEKCRHLGLQVITATMPDWRKLVQRLSFRRRVGMLAEKLRSFAPDYIISNEMWWSPHALKLASRLKCRSACILRDTLAAGPKARQYRLHELDRVLCISAAMQDELERKTDLSENLRLVYNPVFAPAVEVPETDLHPQLKKFPHVQNWLLTIGRVGERKNQLECVRVLGRLHEAGLKNYGLILAGSVDDDYLPKLRETISQLKLENFVCIAGQMTQIGNLIQQCEITLLTSEREGLPRSIIESFLLGKACFSTPLPGLDEIYGAQCSRFVSPEPNASALAAIIINALANPSELRRHATTVQETVREKFAPESYWPKMRVALG
jgi:glycosyltransferase involved in cell wall biosynthesis